MKKTLLVFGFVSMFLLTGFITTSAVNVSTRQVTSLGKTIYVDDSGGKDYTRIQEAIDAAESGDTVFVYSGTYVECIYIQYKTITLKGQDKGTTIIDGNQFTAVYVDWSDEVSISGFTIKNAAEFGGIYLTHSNANIISDNTIILNWANGITLSSSNSNTISGNTILNNDVDGICLYTSNSNTISGNTISNNIYGIVLTQSNSNTISGSNTIISNLEVGIEITSSSGNTISCNAITLNGNVGIDLTSSSSNTIRGNIISDNDNGILLADNSNNNIIGDSKNDLLKNTISNNKIGGIYISPKSQHIRESKGYTRNGLLQNNIFKDNGNDVIGLSAIGVSPTLNIEQTSSSQAASSSSAYLSTSTTSSTATTSKSSLTASR